MPPLTAADASLVTLAAANRILDGHLDHPGTLDPKMAILLMRPWCCMRWLNGEVVSVDVPGEGDWVAVLVGWNLHCGDATLGRWRSCDAQEAIGDALHFALTM